MIKHIVFFKFKSLPEKEGNMYKIKVELEKLSTIITELKEIHVGININSTEYWDLCLEAIVEDMAALNAYATHPAHQTIVKKMIAPIKEDRACIDYIL